MCTFSMVKWWGTFLAVLFCAQVVEARSLAVVIGVSDYDDRVGIRSLPFVCNDATQLTHTLSQGGRFEVITLRSQETDALQPTKKNIESTLQKVLSPENCHSEDTVVVYFSGHGTLSSEDDEKTLLLVKDSVLHDESTYLSAQWIRETLQKCPARHKLFLIDACHAGGKRSALTKMVSPLVEGGVEGVVTLASCKINQKSKFWDEKSMSFFTYWLNEGMKGYSDENRDGKVSSDELFEYIYRNLELTRGVRQHGQMPVIVTTRTTSHFDVIRPRPRDLQGVLDDFADQIVTQMELLQIPQLYVEQFQTPTSKVLSDANEQNHWKSTVDYCRRELERLIQVKSSGKGFSLAKNSNVKGVAMLKNQLAPENQDAKGKEVYILSSLLDTPELALPPSEIRAKVYRKHTDETTLPSPPAASPNLGNTTGNGEAANTLPSQGKREVHIEVKGSDGRFTPRPIQWIHGAAYVSLDVGEVYRIVVRDPTIKGRPTGVRLLVDGQNTLPQYMPYVATKFAIVETAAEQPTSGTASGTASNTASGAVGASDLVYRPHVRLDHARYWILREPISYYFHGFFQEVGTKGRYGEFTVTQATHANRTAEEYPREIGLITVGFYDLHRTRGVQQDVMTVPGKVNPHPIFVVDGYELGVLTECIQIRYASAASLQAASSP